jgi:hypothetical protein
VGERQILPVQQNRTAKGFMQSILRRLGAKKKRAAADCPRMRADLGARAIKIERPG